jgi:multidrug transporter EmrE-like cation transporter
MHWILLIIAGLFEVGFTTSLKLSEGFTNWKWAAGFVVCVIISFVFLTKAPLEQFWSVYFTLKKMLISGGFSLSAC